MDLKILEIFPSIPLFLLKHYMTGMTSESNAGLFDSYMPMFLVFYKGIVSWKPADLMEVVDYLEHLDKLGKGKKTNF
jgi:hypothetical protein